MQKQHFKWAYPPRKFNEIVSLNFLMRGKHHNIYQKGLSGCNQSSDKCANVKLMYEE